MNDRDPAADRASARPAVSSSPTTRAADASVRERVTLARALFELEHVQRLEQARLLRMACRLALRTAPDDVGRHAAFERWRRECANALALARADGAEPAPTLVFCARRPASAWPTARELARASLEFDDCRAGRRLALR